MPTRIPRRSVFLFILTGICICILLFADFGKPTSLLMDSVINLGHIPLFAIVAAMVLWSLDRNYHFHTRGKTYVLAFILSAGFALASEIIQQFTPERTFQFGDILNDLIGSGSLLLVSYQYTRRLARRTRASMIAVVIISLLAASMPVLAAAAEEMRTMREFPLIASFETRLELKRWVPKEGVLKRVEMHVTHGAHSLNVVFSPGLYPGITMSNPPRNWQGYSTLTFDAYLEGKRSMALSVCINDREDIEKYEDRYNQTFILSPGPNVLTIPLVEVEHAPKGRLMNMKHISVLCFFSYKLKEVRTVYFDNFRLKRHG